MTSSFETVLLDDVIRYICHGMIVVSVVYLLRWLSKGGCSPAPYGRYGATDVPRTVNPTIGWIVMESPSFLLPFFFAFFSSCADAPLNKVVLGPFMLHYFFRSFIYPFLLKNGHPAPWFIVTSAFIFTTFNGFMQGYYMICCESFPPDYLKRLNFIIGLLLFFLAWGVNIHSDFILKNLRKTGETGYKIPRGGLFELVSCANYFGEILEWWSYALASWSYPALSFAIWTSTFLILRAIDHHRYYHMEFKRYPVSRKAVIPWLL